MGVVQDRAPLYDLQKPDLVFENTIAALERSCVHEWEWQEEQEEIKKQETKKALEEEEKKRNETGTESVVGSAKETDAATTPKASPQDPLPSQAPSRVPSFTALLVPSQVSSNISTRTASQASLNSSSVPNSHRPLSFSTNIPRLGTVAAPPPSTTNNNAAQTFPSTSYTPHDRGHFLAYSAPGSRNASVDNTPFVSRPVSPTHLHGLGVRSGQSHGSLLRPIASTSRLNQLLAEEGYRRSLSPLADVSESGNAVGEEAQWQEEDMVANLSLSQGWIHPDDISAFVETVSWRPSRPSSRSPRPLSRGHSHSPRATSPSDGEMEGGGRLYLPGLGHPDVISEVGSRARTPVVSSSQTRDSSPFRAANYQLAESAAYLRGLAQRHYNMVNAGPGYDTSARPEGGAQPRTSSSSVQTPTGQAPTSSHKGSGHVASQNVDTTPAFTFPAPRNPDTSSFPAFANPDLDLSPSYTVHAEKKPLNTGRPRAASKALNEAYNAANPSSTPRPVIPFLPSNEHIEVNDDDTDTENAAFTARCPIHSESCNGQDVVHKHMTERARNGAGFKDLFPTIHCEDGRVMVDWAKMKDEEMERLKT